MPKGMSIHIGLNNLDEKHYLNSGFPKLKSCRKDAIDMAEIAKKDFTEPISGTPNKILLDEDANTAELEKFLTEAAGKLKSEDILLVTYSGHGGRVTDIRETESDGKSETWCLFDRQFLDDEVYAFLTNFEKGVRILIISDSCHNGTVAGSTGFDPIENIKSLFSSSMFGLRNIRYKSLSIKNNESAGFGGKVQSVNKKVPKKRNFGTLNKIGSDSKLGISKFLGDDILDVINNIPDNEKNYRDVQERVDLELRKKVKAEKKNDFRELIKASVILISACQDWQITFAADSEEQNSKFTEIFKKILIEGNFKDYLGFHQKLWEFFDENAAQLGNIQHPNYYKIGNPSSFFEKQIPFTV